MFSSKRSLLALTLGIGLSLSACAAEQDVDFDFDADAPEKEPMGDGQGHNGAWPQPNCIKGMTYAMTWYPGWINPTGSGYPSSTGGYWNNYNPGLDWVRCDGSWMSPGTSYTSPPIPLQTDAIRAMAWAGAHESYKVKALGVEHEGNGWFAQNWAKQWLSPVNADIYGGLIAAKWNRETTVEIKARVENFTFTGTAALDPNLDDYTLVESMVLFDPLANNPHQPYPGGQCGGSSLTSCVRELRYFVADEFKQHCPNINKWFDSRSCHTPYGCSGLDIHPESYVASFCTLRPYDPQNPESPIERAESCYGGRVRPVKVYVKPGDFVNNFWCMNPPN